MRNNPRLTVEESGAVTHLVLCFLDAFFLGLFKRQVVFLVTVEPHDVRTDVWPKDRIVMIANVMS